MELNVISIKLMAGWPNAKVLIVAFSHVGFLQGPKR